MSKSYPSLPVIPFTAGLTFVHPPETPALVSLDDPAMAVMLDFHYHDAITISEQSTISEAEIEMRICHTHLLLVVDKENNIIGLISAEDILGEKPLKIIQEKRLRRADIHVRSVMTPQNKIVAFNIHDIRHAKVGNIVKTLREQKQHYAIVVEINDTTMTQTVCGLLSLSQISKQLDLDVISDIYEPQTITEFQKEFGKKNK